jgi:lysyl-tRNA synthetase class 2
MVERKVKSSEMIKSIGFEAAENILKLTFTNGVIFTYADVPRKVYEKFTKAESKGKFFHAEIKNNYKGTKLEAK